MEQSPNQNVNSDMQFSSNNNKKLIVIGVVLLLLVGCGSYFLGIKSQQNKPQTKLITTTPTTDTIKVSSPSDIPVTSPTMTTERSWKFYSSRDNKTYLNIENEYTFQIPDGYNVYENLSKEKNEWSYDVEVMSDESKKCLLPVLEKTGNPCSLTDQPLSLVSIKIEKMDLNTDLTTWVKNKFPTPTDVPQNRLEYIKAVDQTYLKNGVATHDTFGMGDGPSYRFFYDKQRKVMVEFTGYSIEKNTVAQSVMNSFMFK
jgi:hypothetical protein